MRVPHHRLLNLPIDVIEDIVDVRRPSSNLGFDTMENLYVHVELSVVMSKVQD